VHLLECDFEEFLFKNPRLLLQHFDGGDVELTVLRQRRLPIGVADMILIEGDIKPNGRITVVELKRDTLDEDAVAQTLRYMGAFRSICGGAALCEAQLHGVLAAPSITKRAEYAIHALDALHFYRISQVDGLQWSLSIALQDTATPLLSPGEAQYWRNSAPPHRLSRMIAHLRDGHQKPHVDAP
jgi:RecB family endonuclease NucS